MKKATLAQITILLSLHSHLLNVCLGPKATASNYPKSTYIQM